MTWMRDAGERILGVARTNEKRESERPKYQGFGGSRSLDVELGARNYVTLTFARSSRNGSITSAASPGGPKAGQSKDTGDLPPIDVEVANPWSAVAKDWFKNSQ
jgi:hypothetical protein